MNLALNIRAYLFVLGIIAIGSASVVYFTKDRIYINWALMLSMVTGAAFLLTDEFFIFACVLNIIIFLILRGKQEIDGICIFFILLPFIPLEFGKEIPFPGLERFYGINFSRALIIVMLLPIYLRDVLNKKISLIKYDKYVVRYLIFLFLLGFRDMNITSVFRQGLDLLLDCYVVYYVLSRYINTQDKFVKIVKGMIFTTYIISLIAIFETFKHWTLFGAFLTDAMMLSERSGFLRAYAAFTHPIALGIYLTTMIGPLIFLRFYKNDNKRYYNLVSFTVFTAILCTFSRGPIIGVVITILSLAILNRGIFNKIIPAMIILTIISMMIMPKVFQSLIDNLPFIGKAEQGSVTYRQMLFTNSVKVIKKSPFIGYKTNVYMRFSEMQDLKKYGGAIAGGYIDMVNSYLSIALSCGLIGLGLYLSIFATLLYNLFKIFMKANDITIKLLGQSISIYIISFMGMIFTVSMIGSLYQYNWCIFGLGFAYINMASKRLVHAAEHSPSEMIRNNKG